MPEMSYEQTCNLSAGPVMARHATGHGGHVAASAITQHRHCCLVKDRLPTMRHSARAQEGSWSVNPPGWWGLAVSDCPDSGACTQSAACRLIKGSIAALSHRCTHRRTRRCWSKCCHRCEGRRRRQGRARGHRCRGICGLLAQNDMDILDQIHIQSLVLLRGIQCPNHKLLT